MAEEQGSEKEKSGGETGHPGSWSCKLLEQREGQKVSQERKTGNCDRKFPQYTFIELDQVISPVVVQELVHNSAVLYSHIAIAGAWDPVL